MGLSRTMEEMMEHEVTGIFEVALVPATDADASVGRLTLTKTFSGALDASSVGQMLAFGTSVEGSAGYVAMELVIGALEGRSGTFALQHSGTMDRGAPTLSVTVVPDSGTEELEGLAGSMTIDVVDGEHRYGFRYTLPI